MGVGGLQGRGNGWGHWFFRVLGLFPRRDLEGGERGKNIIVRNGGGRWKNNVFFFPIRLSQFPQERKQKEGEEKKKRKKKQTFETRHTRRHGLASWLSVLLMCSLSFVVVDKQECKTNRFTVQAVMAPKELKINHDANA